MPFQLFHKKRFPFSKVLWTVLVCYLCIVGLSVTVVYFFPDRGNRHQELGILLTPYYLIKLVVNTLFFAGFYFYALNFFYHLLSEKKGFFYYFGGILLFTAIFNGYFLVNDLLRPDTIQGAWSAVAMIAFFVMCLLLSALPALLIAFIVYIIDEKKHRKLLEAQKLQLEIEKAHANLNFLKAQINPHFLHNTLNFLYAKSLPYSPELSEGILTLSEIMRYALSDPARGEGKVALKDEVEHLRNVIKINQLRYNNHLQVYFEVDGVVNGVTIIPFVLITIVENAFKHGDLKSIEQPIAIRLSIDSKGIHFYCRNKKKKGPREISTGIGLDNIRKRLDLAYAEGYSLQIKDEYDLYTTQLSIQTP
ncbi:sensor histidine kinase [Paraflavitalea pollutisoli]|uniref:sensor histidine kinase n=1 Tax=Paraflavitalea pollutisoli TaxID=3034143 RepID=UPI0023EBB11F|nr:histidine kinase [Paraflavitalea sp. H1-2-19X]